MPTCGRRDPVRRACCAPASRISGGSCRATRSPDLVLLDVEGFEGEVLEGFDEQFRPGLMVIELRDTFLREVGSSAALVCERLASMGYALYTLDGRTATSRRRPAGAQRRGRARQPGARAIRRPAKSPAAPETMSRLRVAIVADLLQEGWPSMDLVADMLMAELGRDGSAVDPLLVRPAFRPRLTPLLHRNNGRPALMIDRIAHRYWDYPRFLRQRPDADVFHIVDHSYAHLASDLPGRHGRGDLSRRRRLQDVARPGAPRVEPAAGARRARVARPSRGGVRRVRQRGDARGARAPRRWSRPIGCQSCRSACIPPARPNRVERPTKRRRWSPGRAGGPSCCTSAARFRASGSTCCSR